MSWKLECVGSGPHCALCPAASVRIGPPRLRVGRVLQTAELWERLLPNEEIRNTVSREHFEIHEIRAEDAGEEVAFALRNLSANGTFVNGTLVANDTRLQVGDVVSVGSVASEYGSRPALQFRLVAGSKYDNAMVVATSVTGATAERDKLAQDQVADHNQFEFCLEPADTGLQVPPPSIPLTAAGDIWILRVGRSIQPASLWETLVPDAALRSAISRVHFEVRVEKIHCAPDDMLQEQGKHTIATLQNLSSAGTFCNGNFVRDSSELRCGDVIAVPRPSKSDDGAPLVQFRFRAAAAGGPIGIAQPVKPWQLSDLAHQVEFQLSSEVDVQPPTEATGPVLRLCSAAQDSVSAPPSPSHSFTEQQQLQQQLEGQPRVRVSIAALPPPFTLECSTSSCLLPSGLALLPRMLRILEASCLQAQLRVGRAVQPSGFWEALLPDESTRISVSREHFEILVEEDNLVLVNLSAAGTCVNNKRILDRVPVLAGDRISVGTSRDGGGPAIMFCLAVACNRQDVSAIHSKEEVEYTAVERAPSGMMEDTAATAAVVAAMEADEEQGEVSAIAVQEAAVVALSASHRGARCASRGSFNPSLHVVAPGADCTAKAIPATSRESQPWISVVVPYFGDTCARHRSPGRPFRMPARGQRRWVLCEL
mmetsp:Transcript_59931/g.118868  ORF Transcript_59931/g.118868 Transcript_59931/m.118868 type:complete len:652 (-) Transcript_59931:79-2034(-)